jgi:hypothetical protein
MGALQQTRQRRQPALAMAPTSFGNDGWESLALVMAKIKMVKASTSSKNGAHNLW